MPDTFTIIKKFLPDILVDMLLMARRHRRVHGKFPNMLNPKSFNEMIVYRNLFDRNPLLTKFSDKLAVRSYVASKVGSGILPKLYWTTNSPTDIPFDDLPNSYVVKPTHGSGWVKLVHDKSLTNTTEIIVACRYWLMQSHYRTTRERVYRTISPSIIVEEFIGAHLTRPPEDYKLYVFGGKVEMIELLTGRFNDLRSNIFDRFWNRIKVEYVGIPPLEEDLPAPKKLAEMIRIAETLAEGVDFVRVDLYDSAEKIYFGELTVSPGAGLDIFDPPSFDLYLGFLWRRSRCDRLSKSTLGTRTRFLEKSGLRR